MKTMSFTCCHYGSDYLGWAIKSVYPYVDECWVVYSEKPSHGQSTTMKNPDTKQKVRNSLYRFGDPDNKIRWKEGTYAHEGIHRSEARHIADKIGADLIVVVDADEVWQEDGLKKSIEYARSNDANVFKAHIIHFWRSFEWVCRDTMMPDRIIKPGRTGLGYLPNHESPILHFGYARKIEDITYKIAIHGHKNEWRPKWFKRFKEWKPGCGMKDVHPTCLNIWTPQKFDKTTLPQIMKEHPYYNKDII